MSEVHMLIRSTSAIASANSDVVYSKVYKARDLVSHSVQKIREGCNYHALFAALFAVRALDVEDQYLAVFVLVQPNALCSLLSADLLVHHHESRVKEQV